MSHLDRDPFSREFARSIQPPALRSPQLLGCIAVVDGLGVSKWL
jgi:hypothetical protein